jgi:hypothetical protein
VKKNHQASFDVFIKGILALLIVFVMVSCATTIPELQVQYTLPLPSGQLKGRAVALTIEDRRADKSILGKGAIGEFNRFSNSVSLSVGDANQKGSKVGIFQVSSLMGEAFKRRLENSGVKVISAKTLGPPSLAIVVKVFSLDLVGREWLAKMSYEAILAGEGGAVATQFVNGEAKRYKIIGRDSADALMSEIFTDMVNSLNLARLFEQAGL